MPTSESGKFFYYLVDSKLHDALDYYYYSLSSIIAGPAIGVIIITMTISYPLKAHSKDTHLSQKEKRHSLVGFSFLSLKIYYLSSSHL